MSDRGIFPLGVFSSQHCQSFENRLVQIANIKKVKVKIGSHQEIHRKVKVNMLVVPRDSWESEIFIEQQKEKKGIVPK